MKTTTLKTAINPDNLGYDEIHIEDFDNKNYEFFKLSRDGYVYVTCLDTDRCTRYNSEGQNGKRISKVEYDLAKTNLPAQEAAITPEDIENDARELEAYIAEAEESNTDLEVARIADLYCRHPEGADLEVPAVLNRYGCVDCSKCNVNNCVHRDCMRRNPTDVGGLAECPRLAVKQEQELDDMAEDDNVSLEEYAEKLEKVEREKKLRKERKARAAAKKAAFAYSVNGEVVVTLTEKQVDFVKHLPDTCFWENGLDSEIWVDCLCDDIGGQFAGKPMTVGAMVSTLCEKGLGFRSKQKVNGKKCTGFGLTPLGKQVFAGPEWGLN